MAEISNGLAAFMLFAIVLCVAIMVWPDDTNDEGDDE